MNMETKFEAGESRPRSLTQVIARLSRSQKISLVALPLALLAGGALVESRGAPVAAAPPPVTVTVATPLVRQVAEWDDYSGRFEASKSVEVRPRVSGAIVALHFTDGSIVHQGQLLFKLIRGHSSRPWRKRKPPRRAHAATWRSRKRIMVARFACRVSPCP